MPVRLFVLDRGFVVVGSASVDPDFAFHWRLSPGRTVRRWGTSQGLSELKDGPLPNTVLDPPVERSIPWRAIIEIIYVSEEKWLPHLQPASETPPASSGGSRVRR